MNRPLESHYKILYAIERKGKPQPYSADEIAKHIVKFGKGYNDAVREVIKHSAVLNKQTFLANTSRILNNFGMARSGPFQGVKPSRSKSQGVPNGNLEKCWFAAKNDLLAAKDILVQSNCRSRVRTLCQLGADAKEEVIASLWSAFKKMLPFTMGKTSFGLVGASKILFAVFPEIVLPVDNNQWLTVFQTVDMGDVIRHMEEEISAWESVTGSKLEMCDAEQPQLTLPGIYNVMAMKARR
jgi:hypothetical protein